AGPVPHLRPEAREAHRLPEMAAPRVLGSRTERPVHAVRPAGRAGLQLGGAAAVLGAGPASPACAARVQRDGPARTERRRDGPAGRPVGDRGSRRAAVRWAAARGPGGPVGAVPPARVGAAGAVLHAVARGGLGVRRATPGRIRLFRSEALARRGDAPAGG